LNEHGATVHLLLLPYHYTRKPEASAFSGEYFLSGDIDRSTLAYKQAVFDLHQVYAWVRAETGGAVGVVGFSMGGGIALSLSALTPLDGVFVINPVCNISSLVWTSPLFATVRSDLETGGVTFEDLSTLYATFEPLNATTVKTDRARLVLARSVYDQINDPANYDLLVERWGVRNVITYKAGHLNILRVPKLATDVFSFVAQHGRDELL
jgi:pimeloyl-ACP methyl ester carboxylesterase